MGAIEFDWLIHLDMPVFYENNPVSQIDGFADIVCHKNQSKPQFLPEPFNQTLHMQAGQYIESTERFIEQQYPRPANQCPCLKRKYWAVVDLT